MKWWGHAQRRRGSWRIHLSWSLDSLSLPRLSCGWGDENEAWVALGWGNPYTDPVWLVEVGFPLPAWLERVLT